MVKTLFRTSAMLLLLSGSALAQTWSVDSDSSRLSYGTIKKNSVGEVNSFEKLSGSVSEDGKLQLKIDLGSVETNIDIRNERMRQIVFQSIGSADLTAQLDAAELSQLAVGATTVVDLEAMLNLLGTEIPVETEVFVARISASKVLATTNDMVFLGTEEAGVNAGVDQLKTLAKLNGITRTVPVTLRLVLTTDGKQAAAEPVAAPAPVQMAFAGDVKAGKKVFKKCKACHSVKEGQNKVGPSLHGVIGRQAAAVEGFKYSKVMASADVTWDTESLTEFLAKPKKFLPKNRMAFAGLKKPADIENLLAYLDSASK
ncbi:MULTISPECIES: cytochrome c family protein [unclassified Pseudovibrio]|uniref:c-type cytochrome n=1 Tax=unclassified Pseudovibrio TaxID=2627060 RepID=UPI0007AEA4D9|nr:MULTISPECIES: cytochrome c family protein [unclassified Pseudovibrio]KZL02242.1 Cytochrome c2 iso-2 [Pseudovibrio sp. W74]KZL08214.1 Cytochrome c2 iso-2 [Pseudovibrio sp. Ad14]